jgi:amino acid adenylation domain-containing protein
VTVTDTIEAAGLSAAKRALIDARLRGLRRSAAIPAGERGIEAPLSFAQERLWFLDRLQQGGTAYNIPAALRLPGGVDEAALERALGEIVRRHDALRTTFRDVEGVAAQVVAPFTGFALPVHDLSALGAAAREEAAERLAVEHATRPFDLETGPLFRATLVRLGGEGHLLLLCMHHIVSDGWSLRVLFRELWTLYDAFREGRPSPLPELPLQYADYARWQRDPARAAAREAGMAYWKQKLAGAPEVLELPADHPRPPRPSHRGGRVPVRVSAEVGRRLRALARDEGATLYMVALAAFQALLARYAGTPDVVVGAPIAGRTRREVEELIGFFVNTLVLRADLSGDPPFRRAVARVRETVLGAYEHQEVPFEQLVAELQPERSLSHSSLFQVMFMLDNAEEAPAGSPAPAARGVEVETGTTKFDLTLALTAHAGGIDGALDYSRDLFEPATAERMARHLERVLAQVAEAPDTRLSRLSLAGPEELARLREWNRTEAAYPAELCIHQLFEAQARRTPHAPAVFYLDERLTFGEMDARANRIARHLRRGGVGPEVRVGICLERGMEVLPCILGIMKAGGAWVPVDPGHPAERIAYVLEDSGVRLLLTQERLLGRVPASVPALAVDAAWPEIAAEAAEAPESGVGAENLAYVIYTSGSTGRPKGVAMHHRGVVNYIHWGIDAYGAATGNGAPVFTSMAVDLTLTNLLPLFAGLPVRFLPEESPVESLARTLKEKPGFGLIKITPVHLSLLTPLLTAEEAADAARTLVIGADFLVAEPTVFWQDHVPGVRLMNEYGPTETVVGCSAYTLPTGVHRTGPVPVGPPIHNLTFHVLDAHGQPAPIGLAGELYIGGAGVARGYLGRAALTAEKFVPDPFAAPGARMYRTGDRARWLADGNLTILGRTDRQVKVRGYRVELGEIEAALRKRDGVRDALVVLREDRPGDRRLVGYVVGDADPAALRRELLEALPEYMVPGAFVMLDALPQTATGKLDPKTLPAPRQAAGDEEDEPASYLEARLIQVWEELLGVEGVGPTQSFFELGGNSLLALRLFAQVNRRIGCDLPVATLFAGATVRHMAAAIAAQRGDGAPARATIVPLQPGGTLPPLFLVHSADREVMGYVNLVRHLGPGQPVFGIRDRGEDMSRPLATIAAEYVREVRAAQPRGPYYLGGWSFGGFVAFEMALELERMGEAVAFVGLLDTMSPELVQRWPWNGDADLAVGLATDVAAKHRRPFSMDREALRGLPLEEAVRRAVEELHAQGAAPDGFDPAALLAACTVMRDRIRSRTGYVPGRFGGTLSLFRAETVSPQMEEFFAPYGDEERRTLGWSRHAARPVEVHRVPGSHATIGAEPNARVLARSLADSLAQARARVAPGGEPA